ncbi:hypothetical protein ACP70R_007788 [Stipagrostis hirtigluma subsp. patula]
MRRPPFRCALWILGLLCLSALLHVQVCAERRKATWPALRPLQITKDQAGESPLPPSPALHVLGGPAQIMHGLGDLPPLPPSPALHALGGPPQIMNGLGDLPPLLPSPTVHVLGGPAQIIDGLDGMPPEDQYQSFFGDPEPESYHGLDDQQQNAIQELIADPPTQNEPVNRTVYISRRLMLQQAMEQLNLAVHVSGYEIEGFRRKGWLLMDMPCAAGSNLKDPLKIYAEDLSDTVDEAAEAAALSALRATKMLMHSYIVDALNYMTASRGVEINDFSKTLIHEKDKKLASSRFWEQMFQEHAEKMNKEAVAANARYNALVTDIRKICAAFTDVIPLTVLPDGLRAQNIATASFALTAEFDSPARLDQLGRALFKLISGNTIIVPASPAF